MDPVDPAGLVLAQIRAQAAAWRRSARAERPQVSGEQSSAAAESARDWVAQVAVAIAAIPEDAPRRRQRAFRIYLEARLARECGIANREHPEFQELVDRVLTTMEADARLRSAIETAGEQLLRSASA